MRDGDVTDMEEVVDGGLTISILTFELSAETLVQQCERKIFILLDPGFNQQICYTETEIEGFFKNLCQNSATNNSSDISVERNHSTFKKLLRSLK